MTYVRVFGATPEVVYVGYTPGYQGTVIDPATGVVVYGTGYAYDPWVGTAWYSAPVTYGYGAAVAYTPWTGWSVTFGMGRMLSMRLESEDVELGVTRDFDEALLWLMRPPAG